MDDFTKAGGLLDLVKGTNTHRINKNKLDERMTKGGEGSRGGKVIGHSGSGKPIYASAHESGNSFTDSYKHFTAADHGDAAETHGTLKHLARNYASKAKKQGRDADAAAHEAAQKYHRHMAVAHIHQASAMNKKNGHSDSQRRASVQEGRDAATAAHAHHGAASGTFVASKEVPSQAKRRLKEAVDKSMNDNPDLVKGDKEGSRGGNVIGHTSSGKAIYAHKHETPKHFVDAHKDFSEQDHKDAGQAHSELKNKATEKLAEHNIGAAEHSKQTSTAVYHHHMATAHLLTHAALNTERNNREARAAAVHRKPKKKDMTRMRQRGHAAAVNASEHHGAVFGKSVDDTPDLVKGGKEGSRGGHVIGHTKSGHAIYASATSYDFQRHHAGMSSGDHMQAAAHHTERKQHAQREHGRLHDKVSAMGKKQSVDAFEYNAADAAKTKAVRATKYHSAMAQAHHVASEQKHHEDKKSTANLQGRSEDKAKHQSHANRKEYEVEQHVERAAKQIERLHGTEHTALKHGVPSESATRDSHRQAAATYPEHHYSKSIDANPDLVKGDKEGSRGGHVIGHTSSGKAIYARPDHPSHKHFTHKDHGDAEDLHEKLSEAAFDRMDATTSSRASGGAGRDTRRAHEKEGDEHYAHAMHHMDKRNEKTPKPKIHKLGDLTIGHKIGSTYEVASVSWDNKQVVLKPQAGTRLAASGKKVTFTWDGAGYKRQGEYLASGDRGTIKKSTPQFNLDYGEYVKSTYEA